MNKSSGEKIYVDEKSTQMYSAKIYHRLRKMLEVSRQEEEMKAKFTSLSIASFLLFAVLPPVLDLPMWGLAIPIWFVFFGIYCAVYWRKDSDLNK